MLKAISIVAAVAAMAAASAGAMVPAAKAGNPPSQLAQPLGPSEDPIGAVIEQAEAAEGENCAVVAGYEQAALRNAASLEKMAWAPFGRAEKGWAIYQPLAAREVGTNCAPDTPGFAAAVARWQQAHGLGGDGEATTQTLTLMKAGWQKARPYVALRGSGVCPDAPSESGLVTLDADEGYMGKRVALRPKVAEAYRAMVAAARADLPELASDPQMLRIFSGYRSPSYDAGRCARDHNCGGAERATCSVHRTAEAFDLVVGNAPGHSVDSSADANRLAMSRTPAYRWLVANAGRFGFINYSFEPWHWEYVGVTATPQPLQQAANN